MPQPLTMAEFTTGVTIWQTKNWPADFHNGFYKKMATANPNGVFNGAWWPSFLQELKRWRATRRVSNALITANATAQWPALSAAWTANVAPFSNLDISGVTWNQVGPFFSVVSPIKPVKSPVFASKFCHFLAPGLYPVVDWTVIGHRWATKPYRQYFEHFQQEWAATAPATQTLLRTQLGLLIPAALPNYPWTIKIVELCIIGGHP
jgi:hypothetical protein